MGDVPGLPSVLIVGGSLDGHEVKLSPGSNLIVGSGRLANLRLEHAEIELAHIKIVWDDLGISMVDNGSRKGTWVNGEQVETAGLLDGDTIEFVAPGSKVTPPAPKVKLRIPKGSVPDAPPPPPPPPEVVAKPASGLARAAGQARILARRQRSALRMPDVDWKRLAIGLGGFLALVLVGWLVKRLFFTAPQIDRVEPARAEMGQEITITGARFDTDAADNQVWFGTLPVVPGAATGYSLLVRVPALPTSGPVALSVETSSGRSRPVSLTLLAPLRVTAVDPPGALPGDEVVLHGGGFAEGLTVTVGGQAASIVKTEPQAVRFQMPQLTGSPGSAHQVLVAWGGRSASPVMLYLGRLPLVSAVEPARGVAGDLVSVRGAGFTADSTVSFDGQPALVAAASASELLVVVPPSSRFEAEVSVPVVVHARGRASSEAPGFTLQRLVEGTWVLRFIAGAVGEGGATGQATVGTELAPVLLLSASDESRSPGARAVAVARALDAAVDRARVGKAAAFEVREQPEICVALVGAPDRLLRVLPQDAAAYQTPPGELGRGAPPTAIALARHWAAVLTDTVAIATSGAQPRATAELGPPWSVAFAELRAALPWQYGSGVASARVGAISPELKRMLREAALRVP